MHAGTVLLHGREMWDGTRGAIAAHGQAARTEGFCVNRQQLRLSQRSRRAQKLGFVGGPLFFIFFHLFLMEGVRLSERVGETNIRDCLVAAFCRAKRSRLCSGLRFAWR